MNVRFSLKYCVLGSIGILMFSGALLHVKLLPETAACGNNPNCPDGWSVGRSYCDSTPCSCGANLISQTCFTEEGTCNATGAPVIYAHCYQGSCCCPSGNCAGQGGGGGGGGGEVGTVGDTCSSDWDCYAGEYCDPGTGTCQEYGSGGGPGGILP